MSYEVTATRRRPQKLDDLIGQEFVAETLRNSIKSGKIAHAYLFSGPRGCGKTSTARILAKALNCQSGPTPDPCGTCTSCQEITKGSSMDVIEIDGASNTSVNDVRQIKDEVLFPPNSSRYKIYIIDEVHMLSTSAFNALLKTIEEPPPYVIFIFATTELQKVPATIKSRCQQFNFRLVPVEQVKQQLAKAAAEINIQADDEALYWIARESTGSMRDAYTLFDQVAAFSGDHITFDKIRTKLGLVGVDRMNELFECCIDSNRKGAVEKLDVFLQAGISIEQLISNTADYLRSMLLIKTGITNEALLGQSPERYSKKVLDCWNAVQFERAVSIFLQLYRDIRYSLSPRYETELAFSRLCSLKEYVSGAEVKNAIEAARKLLETAPASPVQNQSTAAPAHTAAHPSVSSAAGTENAMQNTASFQTAAAGPAVTQSSTGIPVQHETSSYVPGMPHFSALDEVPGEVPGKTSTAESTDDYSGAPCPEDPGTQPPFVSGGTVPPVNTAVNDDGVSEESELPEDDSSAQDEVSSADEENAEESTPPDTENTAPVQEEVPAPAAAAQTVPPPSSGADSIQTADGRMLSMDQLRAAVIAELSVNDALTASSLMQTSAWKYSSGMITAQIASAFQKVQLDKKAHDLSQFLTAYCGKDTAFTVNVVIPETEKKEQIEIPAQVDILCRVFKGSIVGGKQ